MSTVSLPINMRVRQQPDVCIHLKRSIDGNGKILIQKGEEVTPSDVIGKYTINQGFTTVNLAQKLNVNPKEVIKYLQRETGKTIYQGELLALKSNLLGKTVVTSPTDGVIDNLDENSGIIRLKLVSKELPLTAGVYGIVDDVNQTNGEIIIRTLATEIYGLIGGGHERSGVLNILNEAGNLINMNQISPTMSYQIVVSGAYIYKDTLRKAASVGITGIVCGGMNVADYLSIGGSLDLSKTTTSDIGLTVMATEGFGILPIGEDIFSTLKAHYGKHVFLNGNSKLLLLPSTNADSILRIRKTVLPINQSNRIIPELLVKDAAVGQSVRVVWPPFMGSQGKILSIDQQPTTLVSGISTYLIEIETKKQKIKVPYTNLELI